MPQDPKAYQGPLAVFTPEELEYIYYEVLLSNPKSQPELPIGTKDAILQKLGRYRASDHRFRLPHQ